jgi:hypothetical protein
MSKFTIEQRKTIKNLALQALCQQKTLEGTSDYVKENSGLEISSDEADRIRKAFRKEAREWLSVLASSNHEYIAEYRDRTNLFANILGVLYLNKLVNSYRILL